ncbi:hypothetical protein QR680_009145 [Steinernema hermaphroditum]|uniref:Tyr recombinase domain-containing protein n=1 Tax=Steinernema hermaphroditum TaxID=289476 RepID=A0AA39IL08_9BILA|nr:hypothetical protein QR680_009145 [Steinernema hermaphroditum]
MTDDSNSLHGVLRDFVCNVIEAELRKKPIPKWMSAHSPFDIKDHTNHSQIDTNFQVHLKRMSYNNGKNKGGLPRRAKSHHLHKDRYEELGTRAVLAAHNENVDKINAEALRKVPGESTVYEAIDEPAVDCPFTVPLPGPESFQHRAASGMPKHHLELKEGAIVMLCRSLDVEAGLCNGTKLIVTELLQHGVMCKKVRQAIGCFLSPPSVKEAIAVINAAKDASTVRRYNQLVTKFLSWRKDPRSCISSSEVLAYLSAVFHDAGSASSVTMAAAAIKWYCNLIEEQHLESFWTKSFMEGVRRLAPAPIHRFKITPADMSLIASSKSSAPKDRRIIAYVSLLFAGCLRPMQGASLRRDDLKFSSDGVMLIEADKTNKKGPAKWVPVQRTGNSSNSVCAVQLLETWLQVAPMFVFPNLSKPFQHMSYGSARREWKRLAAELGIKNPITLHGFRGGAATEAIKNGAPIDELMRFGRWKRVETLEAYVEVRLPKIP